MSAAGRTVPPSVSATGRTVPPSVSATERTVSAGETLARRRALVTGGGSGIGAAIAAALTRAGAEVRTADIDPATGPDFVCDVSDDEAVAGMFAEMDAGLGGIDIVVNNVGTAGPCAPVEDTDPEAFDRCLRANAGAAFRVTRHAVPRLKAAGGGSIVNISSTAGHLPYPLRSAYSAAKWAVEGLTRTWAAELGRFGIRVNCVAPGAVDGPRMDRVIAAEAEAAGADPEAVRRGYRDQSAMRTFITADDVAATVAFLCSDAAHHVNGQIISVDGLTETLRTTPPTDLRS